MGKRGDGQTVERRFRLAPATATRLSVAAAVKGMTESELVEWALLPHLAFELPEVPDVTMFPAEAAPTAPAGEGKGQAAKVTLRTIAAS